jgi:hypothetical protein
VVLPVVVSVAGAVVTVVPALRRVLVATGRGVAGERDAGPSPGEGEGSGRGQRTATHEPAESVVLLRSVV